MTFDSPKVKALVERARTPLDVGKMDAEVTAALASPDLTTSDRGQLLLARLIMLQGSLPAQELVALADSAVDSLRTSDDRDALIAAIAAAATIQATNGDLAASLDRCLDMTSTLRANPDIEVSYRASSNFGAALSALGAYELAAPMFARAISNSLDDGSHIGVMVCSSNLAIALSNRAIVAGTTKLDDAESLGYLDLIDHALSAVLADNPAEEMRTFVSASLAHSAQLRGDMEAAATHWGDLNALTAHESPPLVQYLCLIEAPLAVRRGDLDHAHRLIERTLEHLPTPHRIPLGRVHALRIRSALHEQSGDLAAALDDARAATNMVLRETNGLADLLIAQVDKRAALEEGQRALLSRAHDLSEQALVDELSQVGNRRAYELRIEALSTGPRHGMTVLLCDIDCFKQANDRFGHTFGDDVIKRIAELVVAACGNAETVFRYGGDEFVLLPGDLPADQAIQLAEDIRAAVRSESWTANGEPVSITCSIGVWAGESVDLEHGVAQADHQMYQAKLAGRDAVRSTAVHTPSA